MNDIEIYEDLICCETLTGAKVRFRLPFFVFAYDLPADEERSFPARTRLIFRAEPVDERAGLLMPPVALVCASANRISEHAGAFA